MARLLDRLIHGWNAFNNNDTNTMPFQDYGASYGRNPGRPRLSYINDRSLIASIYTRLAIDVAQLDIKHVRLDDKDRYKETIKSSLNNCLELKANLDQGAQALKIDAALSLFDKGVIAIVPVDTTINPELSGGFDVETIRVGEVLTWYPEHVTIRLYNEKKGMKQDITLEKRAVAIVENPLYQVMNEPNSTLQRLIRKLNMLDTMDEQASSGKLDLIIQLPYVVKSEARQKQANQRRKQIEEQLQGSAYGIAYTDGTEKITQLNRPAENNLLAQIQYLTGLLYSQLGLTEEVMNGTADETAMLNYHNRTIRPIAKAMTESMKVTFLTKTARTQGQDIQFFRNPFSLVSISAWAEISDKLARNEIMTANELRALIGVAPYPDKKADELQNSNMPQTPVPSEPETSTPNEEEEGDNQNGS